MKMLLIIFRVSLEEEILRLLRDLDVKAFTEVSHVLGKGEAGSAFDSPAWPGWNALILAAIDDEQTERVVKELKAFRNRLVRQQHDQKIPLRIFLLPCETFI